MEVIKEQSPLINTRNLTVGYFENKSEHILLKNVNLKLCPGELVCFMGLNGVGKSSLIRTLAGIQKPLSGEISYAETGQLSNKVSVVLTDRINASHLTVYELVTFGRYPYLNWQATLSDNDVQIIDRAIHTVRINDLINKRLYQLSDGQMQMVMIARALAQDTSVIMLDEPTAHLDLNNRVEIMSLLRALAHNFNKVVLVASHELDLVLQMADSIWLADDNKQIITGIPEDLVLSGCFDNIFKLKGFDLKTGQVEQFAFRHIAISLNGEGYPFRWTKNALERNGFLIRENASWKVDVQWNESKLCWRIQHNEIDTTVHSIEALLQALI